MRVCLTVTDTQRGGTPSRLCDLATALIRRGHDVQLVSLLPAGEVLEDAARGGVSTLDLGMRSGRDIGGAALRLRRSMSAFAPDVIQSALYHANVISRLVGRTLRRPVVSGYQSIDDELNRTRQLSDRATWRLARRHVAVSQAVAERVSRRCRIPRCAIDVVPIGKTAPVPMEKSIARRMLGVPEDAYVVGFVGRLHPVKNLPTLVAAVEHIPTETWLVVAGDGPERGVVEGRPRTVVTGMLADVSPVYAAVDVVALPSLWEGMPGALVEAMAAGRPVVATRVGGIPEVVTDGVEGFLVSPAQACELAAALQKAIARPELGMAAARTARERFSLESMVEGYLRSWERAIA